MRMEHIRPGRLWEVADKDLPLTKTEFEHIEICRACLDLFNDYSVRAAHEHAQQKTEGNRYEL